MRTIHRKKFISFSIYLINILLLFVFVLKSDFDKSAVVLFQIGVLISYLLFTLIHLILVLMGKTWKMGIMNIFLIVLFVAYQSLDQSFLAGWGESIVGKTIPVLILGLTVLDYCIGRAGDWLKLFFKVKEKNEEPKYTKLFYNVVWKNFKKYWKDYLLIIICSIILFTVAVVAYSMKEILESHYEIKKVQIFNGITEILLNAMLPMAILAVFLIIILVFYYLKTRARNYGIFLTLGMHRNTLYFITALEFSIVFIMSLLVGSLIGRILVEIIVSGMKEHFSFTISLQEMGMKPYLLSIGTILGIIIFSFMAARDIFYDFNVGKSEDMRAIAEKMPGRGKVLLLVIGILICGYSIVQYGKLYNFENEYLLLIFFAGMYLVVRNGIAIWLMKERHNKNYIKRLLIHNHLFHKSKTSAGFIAILTIVQFCILFYFSFQFWGTFIAEDIEAMFPYDFVCLLDERDDKDLKKMKEDYEVDIYEFPMVRVSAYDATEKLENEFKLNERPIQGQHIGVSESTYHQMKLLLDPKYELVNLELNNDKKSIYVVYQQDKSVKAQPTAFYTPRKKPLLHIGRPCESTDIFRKHEKFGNGYYFYEVAGEEIGALTGSFHQGLRENIIVFSDEYFKEASKLWKTTNIFTGKQIEDEEMRIPGFTIDHGVTKLVLMNAEQKDINLLSSELEVINQRHLNEEHELFKSLLPNGAFSNGIYDSSVSYVYKKHETMESIKTERMMKQVMSIAGMILFIFMNFLLMIVKILSEYQMNLKRLELLHCMGMLKTERRKLLRKEIVNYYCILPIIISGLTSAIYTIQVFRARMYTITDILKYLKYYVPTTIVYFIIYVLLMMIITRIYIRKVEKEAIL